MTLLRNPANENIHAGVKLIHHIPIDNKLLKYAGIKVIELEKGANLNETLKDVEACIVPLAGKISVSEGSHHFNSLGTRETVFERKPTDCVYISTGRTFNIIGETPARLAVCYAKAEQQLPTKLIAAGDMNIEHRGEGNNKRMVHNILPDDVPFADSLLVVEVYTESGNWSSYPPHKHDKNRLPEESQLEEIYYHEQNPPQGFVFQRVYTDDRSLDETMTVTNGDAVIVPKGYHPVGVPEGYTAYYLNVMAGPERVWKFHNDPDHEWIIK